MSNKLSRNYPKNSHKSHRKTHSKQQAADKYKIEDAGKRNYHKKSNKLSFYKIKHWLTKRNYYKYTNWNAFFMNILWLVLLSISFAIIYSNLPTLNEIVLWFIPLGGVLLIVTGIFWIKYGYELLKKLTYWFRGERNWVRYVVIIILICLAWQAYSNKEDLFNPAVEASNKTDFTNILPLNLNISFEDFKPSNVEDLDESDASIIQKILYTPPEREEECKEAFSYLNKIRKENGRKKLKWDDRAYELAVNRSKDMVKRNYFDHVTPEGTCAKDMNLDYGFKFWEIVAENCGGMTHYSDGNPIPETNVKEAIDGWMNSRGHRYNLLYAEHVSGAIGCYKSICVFYGVHNNPYGPGAGPCTTGEEGLAFCNNMGKQLGEI